MEETCDLAIVGAGAAGIAAAIFAAEKARSASPLRIILLDGARTVGAKILVSGGGRCNVTHDVVRPNDFQGTLPVIRNVLAAFDEHAAVRWMRSLGVELKREESGKLFPVTDSARTVLHALLSRCAELGIELRAGHRVQEIHAGQSTQFRIIHTAGGLVARRVILATGGRSLPRTGSDGAGWTIARGLGHTVGETFPALVPLILEPGMFHASLSGLSHQAELTTTVDDRPIDRRTGSLLWAHFGISGPVVMDASRFWIINHAGGRRVELLCNLLPGMKLEQVEQWLIAAASNTPRTSLRTMLAERLPDRLCVAVLRHIGLDPGIAIAQLPRQPRRDLARSLTMMPLPVTGDRGWNYAEVTAGGVPLSEIDFRTMESRKTPGLHLVGEILDCDGRIGGFNFQWAWSTGYLAGSASAKLLKG